jgi:hypothetical protein
MGQKRGGVMIKTTFRLIVLLLLVVGWSLAGLSLHVIRTHDDIPITLVPKESFGIRDTYVDTRKWTLDDIPRHTPLVTKLVRNGKTDVLKHVVPTGSDVGTQINDALNRAPTKEADKPATSADAAGKVLSWIN